MSKRVLPQRGKVKVLFHNGEGEEGKQPIQGGLNGEAFLIPRNQEVVVDVRWLHGVFATAMTTEYDRGEDGRGLAQARKVPRYPYELIEIVEDGDAKAEAEEKGKADAKAKAEVDAKGGK